MTMWSHCQLRIVECKETFRNDRNMTRIRQNNILYEWTNGLNTLNNEIISHHISTSEGEDERKAFGEDSLVTLISYKNLAHDGSTPCGQRSDTHQFPSTLYPPSIVGSICVACGGSLHRWTEQHPSEFLRKRFLAQ